LPCRAIRPSRLRLWFRGTGRRGEDHDTTAARVVPGRATGVVPSRAVSSQPGGSERRIVLAQVVARWSCCWSRLCRLN
jgi:hypothetical protein